MKRAVFLFFHSVKCGKLSFGCGKRMEKRRFSVEKKAQNCGKDMEYGKGRGKETENPCMDWVCGISGQKGKAVMKTRKK